MTRYDYENSIGKQYNDLTILRLLDKVKGEKLKAEVECVCGNIKTIDAVDILRNHTKNCGCLKRSKLINRNKTTKRKSLTQYKKMPEYGVWSEMKGRYNKDSNSAYHNYGGRGITVCDAWNSSFSNFIDDMGERPSKEHSLDRIDNEKGYSLDNCRWTDRTTQNRNQRIRKDNLSGVKGVYEIKENKFVAYINVNKERKHLGTFYNLDEAKNARKQAELTYW